MKRVNLSGCPLRGVLEVGNCPAFQGRCPFANAGANNATYDDIAGVLEFMPQSHTDASNDGALDLKHRRTVQTLQAKIKEMEPRARYVTKLSSGELLVEHMENLSMQNDLRLLSTPTKMVTPHSDMIVSFAADIIGCNIREQDCVDYIVALYRIYSALEDAWIITSDGRVRTLHKAELSRKTVVRNELSYFFKIDASSVHDYIEENHPPSIVERDIVKRIKHLVVVNPVLLIAYLFATYGGIMQACEFRKGLRLCAPNVCRSCVFRDLDTAPCPLAYHVAVDSLGLSPDEADEVALELKYVYKMQVAMFYAFDVNRGKAQRILTRRSTSSGEEMVREMNFAYESVVEAFRFSRSLLISETEIGTGTKRLWICEFLVTLLFLVLPLTAFLRIGGISVGEGDL